MPRLNRKKIINPKNNSGKLHNSTLFHQKKPLSNSLITELMHKGVKIDSALLSRKKRNKNK